MSTTEHEHPQIITGRGYLIKSTALRIPEPAIYGKFELLKREELEDLIADLQHEKDRRDGKLEARMAHTDHVQETLIT